MKRRDVLELLTAGGAGTLFGCHPRPVGSGRGERVSRTPRAHLRTNWSRDPYALGAYSYVSRRSPGTGESDKALLGAPVGGRLHFAGEALNPRYAGTVPAAHESGLRAARRLREAGHARVAVIGAGMAGLTAASTLSAAGVRVTVFEARDRIGGRILTDGSLGTPVDLGASWIHGPEGNPLSALADRAGAARDETDDTLVIRGAGGRRSRQLGAPDWLERVIEETPAGVSLGELNAAYFSEIFPAVGLGYPGRDVTLREGYASLLEVLAGDYEVRLSSPVGVVSLAGESVRVTVEGGDGGSFDAALVTVPLGVLKAGTLAFDPPLPAATRGAIERMGMGLLDTLYLRFDDVFWDDATVILTPENGLPRGHFNYWVNFDRILGAPLLMAFHGAGPAHELAGRTDAELLAMAQETLERAYLAA